jgi:hypothetical protein
MLKIGTGISDFREIIETNNFYADKSLLIKDLIDLNDKVTLITRPRRFGKTLNIDMLRYFFSLEHKTRPLFFMALRYGMKDLNTLSIRVDTPPFF